MAKVTLQLDYREVCTIADLIAARLKQGQDKGGLYETRSIVRLAAKVEQLAKGHGGRVAVLARAPAWVFEYVTKGLFPEEHKPVHRSVSRPRSPDPWEITRPSRLPKVLPPKRKPTPKPKPKAAVKAKTTQAPAPTPQPAATVTG
jgi:hypothetical protein